MGWTFTHRPRGMSTLEFFREEFGDGVLDAAATLSEAYIAYQVLDRETRQVRGVIAIVCLIRWSRDWYNFGYEDMDESMSPPARCPERILKLLTPFDFGSEEANQRSREWRARCWDRIKERRQRPKLREGMVIRFPRPLYFNNGAEIAEFVVVSTKPLRLRDARYPHSGEYYRIRRSTLHEGFEVVGSVQPGLF